MRTATIRRRALGLNAELISLNLMPGVVMTQVFEALVSAVPIEVANTMGIPETILMRSRRSAGLE